MRRSSDRMRRSSDRVRRTVCWPVVRQAPVQIPDRNANGDPSAEREPMRKSGAGLSECDKCMDEMNLFLYV